MRYVSAAQMAALEREAEKRYGIPTRILMENAGRSVADIAERWRAGGRARRRVFVLCGTGNNGGDGFVAARHLWNRGHRVTVAVVGNSDRMKPDAAANFRILKRAGVPLRVNPSAARILRLAGGADFVIDAVFGTGLKRPVGGPQRSAIEAVNRARRPILSVDLPSGLDADTGRACGVVARAALVATLGIAKAGLKKWRRSRVVIADISLPRMSPVTGNPRVQTRGNGAKPARAGLAVIVFTAAFFSGGGRAGAEESTWVDKDKDGKVETCIFTEKGIPVREETDQNGDGKADDVMHYKHGLRHFREADGNFDGKKDRWRYYKSDGSLLRYAADMNGDEKQDRWTFLEKGRELVLQEQDRNFDGKVDRRALSENFFDMRGNYYHYRSIWSELDDDFDGVIDVYRVRGVQAPAPDKRGTPINPAYKTRREPAAEAPKKGSAGLWDVEQAMSERQAEEERMNRPIGE